jgi:hypothetical protein
MKRYIILLDGKWQGGSFATEAEAKAVAAKLAGTSKKWSVQSKGGVAPRAAEPPAAAKKG